MTLLREFHERMAAQIFASGGTVEKYIGDEIFAVFGLLKAEVDDAANALRCANGMLAALDAWNGERAGRGEPPLSIGIGLNYGPAVMGDVGSDQGLSFRVIGDTVNTASRLQALTRDLETPLVVADAIVSSINGAQSPELKMLVASLLDQGEHTEGPQRRGSHLDKGPGGLIAALKWTEEKPVCDRTVITLISCPMSAFGTKRTSRDVRLESVMRT